MRLFLDVDGVLLNFESAFARWLNGYMGLDLPPDYQTPSWFFGEILRPDQISEVWHAFLASEDAGNMSPLVPPERFNAVAAQHPVHLLTNFPGPHMHKRVDNLNRAGLDYRSLHYCGLHAFQGRAPRTKAAVVNELRRPDEPALFVDDHPDNCLDVAHNCEGVEVWLMSRRFNADFVHPAVRRAHGWDSVFERLQAAGVAPEAAGGPPAPPAWAATRDDSGGSPD